MALDLPKGRKRKRREEEKRGEREGVKLIYISSTLPYLPFLQEYQATQVVQIVPKMK